jgi:hypothetical protein
MRFRTKLALLGGVAYAAKWVYDTHVAPRQPGAQAFRNESDGAPALERRERTPE